MARLVVSEEAVNRAAHQAINDAMLPGNTDEQVLAHLERAAKLAGMGNIMRQVREQDKRVNAAATARANNDEAALRRLANDNLRRKRGR